jgi:DNA modification methylase
MIDKLINKSLNGVCPYFTMFPIDFPHSILSKYASKDDWVLDPFCGRGTTNYASRILGLPSIGIDSSPVATSLSQAKLANTNPKLIIKAAKQVLNEIEKPQHIPSGEFWKLAFNSDVLTTLCRLREGLLRQCDTASRKALRAIIMGALHGPLGKKTQSYFSNQCMRTYAPKPNYAIKFWKQNRLNPPSVDVCKIIETRAKKYYSQIPRNLGGKIIQGDSRSATTLSKIPKTAQIRWIITSPPYYGMSTYLQDQWLRQWLIGGAETVDYSKVGQVEHSNLDTFSNQLKKVWKNAGSVCQFGAKLVVRFGGINDKQVEPLSIIKQSLKDTGWLIQTCKSAGFSSEGHRQALHISKSIDKAIEEYDVWAKWEGQ